jgi:hypothetical protein
MDTKFAIVVRTACDADGTFGTLFLPGGDALTCAEPPWRENRSNISCIPPGMYACEFNQSPHFGLCPEILNVPGRDFVRIHAGNWAGDMGLGRKSDTEGCLLPGLDFDFWPGSGPSRQRVVTSSRQAFEKLATLLCGGAARPGVRFSLQILDATGIAGRGWGHGA